MARYSLVQVSLDQSIERTSLEEAVRVTRSVARADCALLHRELFGVVVGGLEHDEAMALQAELAGRGFPTLVRDDRDIPVLHAPLRIQRFGVSDGSLSFIDAMGRKQERKPEELSFVAAGHIMDQRWVREEVMRWDIRSTPRGTIKTLKPVRETRPAEVPIFQADFFFWSLPNRLRMEVSADWAGFFQGRPLRPRDEQGMEGFMEALAGLLPEERRNAGLTRRGEGLAYPSMRAYEEEIRWHFLQLRENGG